MRKPCRGAAKRAQTTNGKGNTKVTRVWLQPKPKRAQTPTPGQCRRQNETALQRAGLPRKTINAQTRRQDRNKIRRPRRQPRRKQSQPRRQRCLGGKPARKMFQYACPFCEASVSSSVRTGQIDHRRPCGHRFRVKNGDVAARKYDYVCPFCKGHVASNLKTGRINHRRVCGNQFYVKGGTVSAQTRQHPQRCPACHTVVWSTLLFGRIQATHNTPSGKTMPDKKLASSGEQARHDEIENDHE